MSAVKISITIAFLTIFTITVLRSERTATLINYLFNQNLYLLQKTSELCTSASMAKDEYRHCLSIAKRKQSSFMENWDRTCMRLHQAAVDKQSECDKSEIELDYEYKINPPNKIVPPLRDLLEGLP